MLACSAARSALVSASVRPISASPPVTIGRSNLANSVVFTSPWSVLASSRTVHRITPALVARHQAGRSPRDRQTACPRFLPLPSPTHHPATGSPSDTLRKRCGLRLSKSPATLVTAAKSNDSYAEDDDAVLTDR